MVSREYESLATLLMLRLLIFAQAIDRGIASA
jgi:hypothetical protein